MEKFVSFFPRELEMLGTFQAREERTIQTFPLDEPIYAKYFKVWICEQFAVKSPKAKGHQAPVV